MQENDPKPEGLVLDFTTPPPSKKTYTRYFNFYRDGYVFGGYRSAAAARADQAVAGWGVEAVKIAVPITFTVDA